MIKAGARRCRRNRAGRFDDVAGDWLLTQREGLGEGAGQVLGEL
jgi:hypothetical protein